MEKIGLADAIDSLRAELTTAAARAEEGGISLRVDQATIELSVVSESASEGKLGVRWVVQASGSVSESDAQTHRVSITLTPLKDGKSLYTADEALPQ